MVGALAALPAIATDIYLPSLPTVTQELGASVTAVQWTMSGGLVGGAVGQLLIGPFSDRYGRRLPLLIGISAHVLLSLLCSIAPGIESLIALRVAQGFFNAAAAVVSLAVIRDRFVGADAARMLSRLMLVVGVAPLFAPTVGSFVSGHWSWRGVFVVLAAIGAALLLVVWRRMPETLPPERRLGRGASVAEESGGVLPGSVAGVPDDGPGPSATPEDGIGRSGMRGVLAGYGVLLRDRRFLALAVIPGLGMAVVMSYVVGSPFVLQTQYGLTEKQFAAVFAVNGLALVCSAQLNAALVHRFSSIRLLRTAVLVQLVLALVLLAVVLTGAGGLLGVLAVLWGVLGMQGMIPANASMLALGRYGHMAGTAAALIGAFQLGVAGLVSPLVGVLGGDARAMSSVIIGSVVVATLVLALGTPAYRRGGWRSLA